jgi:catechol 2,3-dioxygenase-like lactoylglutathione lyase family enzyme
MREMKLVTYLSPDVAAAKDFYQNALDADLLEDALPEYVKIRVGDFVFCIDQGEAADQPRLLFEADPLEDAISLHAFGIQPYAPLQGSEGSRWFSILDPDGREIIFGESM